MPTDFHIRNFADSDYEQVIDLWLETGMGDSERGDTLGTIKNTIDYSGVFYILQHTPTKTVAGTAWITNDGRRLYLHHFGIKPTYQGQKLSHILMDACMRFAKSKNMQIKLEVHQQNKIAINLYEKAGFMYLGDYNIYIIRHYNNN